MDLGLGLIDALVEKASRSSSSEVKHWGKKLRETVSVEERERQARIQVLTSEGSFTTKRARLATDIAESMMTAEEEKEFQLRSRKFEEEHPHKEPTEEDIQLHWKEGKPFRTKQEECVDILRTRHTMFSRRCRTATKYEEFHHMTKLLVNEITVMSRQLRKSFREEDVTPFQSRTMENMEVILDTFNKNEL